MAREALAVTPANRYDLHRMEYRDAPGGQPVPPAPVLSRGSESTSQPEEGSPSVVEPGQASAGLRLIPATSLRIEPNRWLWAGRLPLGAVSLLVGREGLGKSTLAMHVAAELSRARLQGDVAGPARTVVVTFEDDPARTLLPRFLAAGGDPSCLAFVEGAPMLPGDLERLGAMVSECDARLLIVDPLSAALGGGKIDTHRDADVRRVLAGLQALAERDDVSVVGIGHWSKGESGEPLDRVLGSRAFTAAARSVLVLGKPHDDGDLVLAQAKSNLGVAAEALVLSLEAATARDDERCVETSRVVVVGTTDTTARALLRGPASGERAVKRTAAVEWLAAFLAAGPKPVSEVEDAAGAEGISQATLRRSREALDIKPEKLGHGWVWKLPGQVAQDAQVEHLGSEHLDIAGQGPFLGEDAQDAQDEHLGSEHLGPEPPQAPDPDPGNWWSEEHPDEEAHPLSDEHGPPPDDAADAENLAYDVIPAPLGEPEPEEVF